MASKVLPTTPVPRPKPRPLSNGKISSGIAPISITTVEETRPIPITYVLSDSDSALTPLTSPCAVEVTRGPVAAPNHASPKSPVSPHRRPAPHLVDLDPYNIETLGSYVWVLLDRRARVVEPYFVDDAEECKTERLWWPGKVASDSPKEIPLKIRLFGTAPAHVKFVEIHSPCQLNVLPLKDSNNRDRFTIPTFISSLGSDFSGSPMKKTKYDRTETEEQWRFAVTELVRERERGEAGNESDSLPEVGSLEFASIISSPSRNGKESPGKGDRRRKRKRSEVNNDEVDGPKRAGAKRSPVLVDDTLQIPGELLLSMDKARDTEYWPATILAYIPPKPPRKEGKYRLEFLDGSTKDVLRSWFYTWNDSEFATCKLGRWQSEYSEVVNDADDDNSFYTRSRSPSPIARNPPPLVQDFTRLNIREKFAYVKPIMVAILNGQYPPAKYRHDLFIGGGGGREKTKKDAGLRGRMNPEDVGKLGEYLCEWCLRDLGNGKILEPEAKSDKKAISIEIDTDEPANRSTSPAVIEPTLELPPDSFCGSLRSSSQISSSTEVPETRVGSKSNGHIPSSRQQGCDEYEALSGEEKISYCLNVLLPEAILQILLWCNGVRCTTDLLPEAEEMELHERGIKMLEESDWVNDVKRLRERARASLGLGPEEKGGSGKNEGWTFSVTGRPKRSVAKAVSYQE